jgi:uncharacterized protein
MFTGFLYHLRSHGLAISLTEWLMLMQALSKGHAHENLTGFYFLARALLIKKESQFDDFDRAFAAYFEGYSSGAELNDEILAWLENPVLPSFDPNEVLSQLADWDFDRLRKEFEERLQEQKERHDGGSHYIGTGGTSPFGHGGAHPSGIRVGGQGGNRSAVQVASERRFKNLRHDRVLDTRQIGVALRRLRKLALDHQVEELDIEKTIDESAKQAGEIELVFSPPRKNKVKLLLLMDVGGSMTPHTRVCEKLFSAAHAANHFQSFETFFFHNCVYERVYRNMTTGDSVATDDLLKKIDQNWCVIFVGDAWMAPSELTYSNGSVAWGHQHDKPGLAYLKDIKQRSPRSVWLNPENERVWNATSIHMVQQVFPMYPLSVQGITRSIDFLRTSSTHVGGR